jgi:hypothetical protein
MNRIVADPAVDAASIVPDLKTFPLNCFDQVEVLIALHRTENDLSNRQSGRIVYRADSAELAGLNLAAHRVSARTERNSFAIPQPLYMVRCPSHAESLCDKRGYRESGRGIPSQSGT